MLYAIMVYDTILYGNGLSTALFNQIRRLRGVKPSEASVCDINETVGNLICAPISSPNYRKILPLFEISGHNLAPYEEFISAQEETKRKLLPFAGEIKRYGMEYFAGKHLFVFLSMLSSSIHKPNAWMNSPVRDVMEDGGFKQYLDEIDNAGRRRGLYMLNECAERFGFGVASVAANRLCKDGKVPSRDDLVVLCNRMASFPLEACDNATNVNLGAYDALLNKTGGAAS